MEISGKIHAQAEGKSGNHTPKLLDRVKNYISNDLKTVIFRKCRITVKF